MHKLLVLFLFAELSSIPMSAQDAVLRVYADQKRQTHVVFTNGKTTLVAGESGQIGIDSIQITKDGQTAGWLVLYADPDSSSPFAGTLVLWRRGRVI
jgi:hypothetical protein